MDCRWLGNELIPQPNRSFDDEDGDGSIAEWMEIMNDEPSTNLNAGRKIVLGRGDSETESSPASLSTSSRSSPSKCEHERGNSLYVSLPLQEGIRRRLRFKQKQPAAYAKKSKKVRGCRGAAEDKGFGIALKMTKQEKKRLHNQSQEV